MTFGGHLPIAVIYPQLEDFFVKVLRVKVVTDAFMMEQLATAASKAQKTVAEIKNLMFATSEVLDYNSEVSRFQTSIDSLQNSTYLPCNLPSGGQEYRSAEQTFFIVDNKHYAEMFSGKLVLLDFKYEELISLHELFRILRLDGCYLSRHVSPETSAESWNRDNVLTEQFRQCAYAISW